MGFSQQRYWSGLPFPPPEDLPNLGIEPTSLMPPALAMDPLPLAPPGKLIKLRFSKIIFQNQNWNSKNSASRAYVLKQYYTVNVKAE